LILKQIIESRITFGIWKREERSQGSIMLDYWADLTMRWRKSEKETQCAGTPIPRCRTEIGEIRLRIAATSTEVSRFNLLPFLAVSKH
jgi:hypothetical protein